MTRNLASTQPGKRKKAAPAKQRLHGAYGRVFAGHGSQEDAEIILTDLADISGFYQVTSSEASPDVLRFNEGKRFVFARILSLLRMTESERAELEEAARVEALTTYEE